MRTVPLLIVCLLFFQLIFSYPALSRASETAMVQEETVEEIGVFEEIHTDEERIVLVERGVNVLLPNPTARRSLLFVIDHRNRQPIGDNPFRDLLGFDAGGLKVGLGLRYGLCDDLDIGMYRLNGFVEIFDVYEFDARFQFLNEKDFYVNAAFRSGVTWFYQPGVEDAAGVFEQLLVSRSFGNRLVVGTGLLYHSESSNEVKRDIDNEYSAAIPAIFRVKVTSRLEVDLEVVAAVAGYDSKYPSISSSVKYLVHGHTFSLVFSNTQYTSADGIVSNSPRGFSDTVLGFSITREFKL